MDNSVVATTTVERGGDITSWLNSLTIPTHDGYEFDKWVITAGYIYSVNDNATVYIMYRTAGGGQGGSSGNNPSGDAQTVTTYVNGDGDISVQISNLQNEISGQADVQIYFSKALNTVNYDENKFDIFEFGSGMGAKTNIKTDSNIVSFTDEDCSTHDFYRFGFYDESGNRLGQSLWDDGLYITRIKFSLSDGTEKEYSVTK